MTGGFGRPVTATLGTLMTSATNHSALPTNQVANAMISSLTRNNRTQLQTPSTKYANYLARRAGHFWIDKHRSQPWSLLIIDLLQRPTIQRAVTHEHTSTQQLPKIRFAKQLPTTLVQNSQSLLLIAHIDQWSPRFLIEFASTVSLHPTHRTLLLVHDTPLK